QGHRQIAEELRAEVDKARAKTSRGASVAVQFSSPRGSLEGLLELRQPRFNLKDVVLNEKLIARINDVLRQQLRRDWLPLTGKAWPSITLYLLSMLTFL